MKMKTVFIVLSFINFLGFSQTFNDNLEIEKVGEFPTQWDVVSGLATVENVDGYKLISLMHGGIIKPIIKNQTNNYLSTDFTVEFDVFFDQTSSLYGQRFQLRLWDGAYGYEKEGIRYKPFIIYRDGLETDWNLPEIGSAKNHLIEFQTLDPVWRHIKVESTEGKLKIYMDDKLILHLPRFKMKPTILSIGGGINDSKFNARIGFTNFSITNNKEENQNNNDDSCRAYPTENQLQVLADPNSMFNKRLEFLENYSIEDLRGVPAVQYINGQFMLPQQVRFSTSPTENYTVIPIVAHILRQSNGTGGLSLQSLYNCLDRANELFEKYGVYLNIEKINYINDDATFNFIFKNEDANEDDLNDEVIPLKIPDRNIKNKLNIYFVPNAQGSRANSTASWSKFPADGYGNQHIIMNNRHDGGVLVHEIGHWFNLLHTHETAKGLEVASGVNCKYTGDYCCDTPADTNLSGKVDENCNYTAGELDPFRTPYNPDTSNIMSYTAFECRENFSEKQIKRMYNSYLGMEDDRGYTFIADNEIGNLVKQYNWTTGWNQMGFFKKNNEPYIYFFKTSTGDIAIHKMNNDGSQGTKTYTGKFGTDWTNTLLFANKFLFMYKASNGFYQIRKIDEDATLGTVKSGQMEPGNWHFNFISMEGANYLIAINKLESKMQTFKIKSDGTFDGAMYEKSSPTEYDMYEVIRNNIIRYNSNTGKVSILSFQPDGSFKNTTSAKYIDKNFSNLIYVPQYSSNSNNFFSDLLFYNKNNGQVIKHQWLNTSVESKWYDSSKLNANINNGFDCILPYNVVEQNQNKSFVLFSNSKTGEVEIYQLNNNL